MNIVQFIGKVENERQKGKNERLKKSSIISERFHSKSTANDSSHDQALTCVYVCVCFKSGEIMFHLHGYKEYKKTETMMMSFSWKRYPYTYRTYKDEQRVETVRRLCRNGKKVSTYVNIAKPTRHKRILNTIYYNHHFKSFLLLYMIRYI